MFFFFKVEKNESCFQELSASQSPNCSNFDFMLDDFDDSVIQLSKPRLLLTGKDFFAYFTPIIILVGMVGNSFSLAVFTRKNMRKLSASTYLAALSLADICTLVFYVLVEWLRRGLVHINPEATISVLDVNGICQITLYLSYVSRCMSSWIIVAFTVERFNGVCYPLKMMKWNSYKILFTMLVCMACLVLYKPVLSGEHTIRGRTACTANPHHSLLSFILDSCFALLISFFPFIIITTLNVFIVRKVLLRNIRQRDIFTEETKIRLEFTFILFVISFFFVSFNLPYFVIWCRNFLNSHYISTQTDTLVAGDVDYWNGVLLITRTIFYLNYCVNFFLYSMTGASFRRELAAMLHIRKRKKRVFTSRTRLDRQSFNSLRTSSTYRYNPTTSTYASDTV